MGRAFTRRCAAATSARRPTSPVSIRRTGASAGGDSSAAAETPARGIFPQCTHNLLTLHGETLYYNTNLGAVAALSTDAGASALGQPVSRARHGDLLRPAAALAARPDAVPLPRGTLLVAPADTPDIFALDAGTGQMLWRIDLEDATQLLGVAGDCLIAGGAAALLDRPDRAAARPAAARLAGRRGEARLRPRHPGGRLRLLADAGENLRLRPADRRAEEGHRPGRRSASAAETFWSPTAGC